MKKTMIRVGVLLSLLLLAPLSSASVQDLARMADQLDAADEQDFRLALDRARMCIGSRDFSCAEAKIKEASRFMSTPQDRKSLALVRDGLAREQQVAEKERLAAEEQARREEEARRVQAELEDKANRGPSTMSQIVQFGSAFAQAAQEQQQLKAAEHMAAQRNWQALQDAGRQQQARNEQLLNNAAASRGAAASSAASSTAKGSGSAAGADDDGLPHTEFDAWVGKGSSNPDRAATSGSGDTAVQQASAAAACGNSYEGPNEDPQLDTLCQQAAFDACVHRATGLSDYDAEGRASCKNLRSIMEATRSYSYSCQYCPYPY